MSDLFSAKSKIKEGADWRGSITVEIDGDEHELCVRQLVDPELEDVWGKIDRSELEELRERLPSEKMEEHRELVERDDCDESEEARKDELKAELEDETPDIFEILSGETFEGIRLAAKYGVEPDDDDRERVFRERPREIEREYGVKVTTPEDVEPALQDEIEAMIESCTDFTSFEIGTKVLTETVGDEGN
jgi:hypothetical protein